MIAFQNEKKLDSEISKLEKRCKLISFIRLLLALNLILWVLCLLSLQQYILYGILSAVSFAVILVFIFYTNKFFKELNLKRKMKDVYKIHYKRRNNDMIGFLDEGRDFIDKNNYKISDLDIFGSHSLFQYLTVCKTKPGRLKFAHELINPDEHEINYTKCIDSLGSTEDTLTLEASLHEFKDSAKNINYDEFKIVIKQKINLVLSIFIPLLSFIGVWVLFALMFVIKLNPLFFVLGLVANYALCKIFLTNSIFDLDSFKYYELCDAYLHLVDSIISYKSDDEYFNNLKGVIKNKYESLKSLRGVYLSLSTRKNAIANIILNSLFSYDLFMVVYYNRASSNILDLDDLFESVATIECMMSFANLKIDNEITSIPTISDVMTGEGLYHPLVKNCVNNDFTLDGGVVLTGSNMSGKTTFMRTLAINQILFNARSIVCAKSFSSYDMKIFTSLRANDMLSEGISTFYAEILRMKEMNEAIKINKCLILVDEIFKGTNALERIAASKKVIEKFNEYKQNFIISTHDFELCDTPNILNYHFNEDYDEENKITFDYKIKKGKCVSTNALYLLKASGII